MNRKDGALFSISNRDEDEGNNSYTERKLFLLKRQFCIIHELVLTRIGSSSL